MPFYKSTRDRIGHIIRTIKFYLLVCDILRIVSVS